ncbi:MAG: fasciclin domain-containing protein [Candidatus Promineifilaceae bacterium]
MKKLLRFSLLPLCLLLLFSLSLHSTQAAENSIIDVATAEGSFTTLVSLANEAGLGGMLENNGPFTVFAPTDEAFAALGDALAGLDQKQKRQIVLYHIVQGTRTGEQLTDVSAVGTALGQTIAVSVSDDGDVVLNNTATVSLADIDASNGLIHVVDAVLVPAGILPEPEVTEEVAEETEAETEEVTEAAPPPRAVDPLEDLFFDPDGPYGDPRVTLDSAELEAVLNLVPALRKYNQRDFAAATVITAAAAEEMRNMLDSGMENGTKTLCTDYSALFILMAVAPRFEQAGDAQPLVNRYEAGVTRLLDSNRSFALYCINDGGFNQLNWGLARIGAQDAMDTLIPLAEQMLTMVEEAPEPVAPVVEESAETEAASETEAAETEEGTTSEESAETEASATGNDEQVSFDSEAELEAALEEAFDRLFDSPEGDFAEPRVSFDFPNILEEDEKTALFAVPHVDYSNFDFLASVTFTNVFIAGMGGHLDSITSFDNAIGCTNYVNMYLWVARAPKFRDIPATRLAMVNRYEATINELLDNNLPFVLYCVNGGQFSSFNKLLARDGVSEALEIFIPLLTEAGDAALVQ